MRNAHWFFIVPTLAATRSIRPAEPPLLNAVQEELQNLRLFLEILRHLIFRHILGSLRIFKRPRVTNTTQVMHIHKYMN
jgi:hypothetical protein